MTLSPPLADQQLVWHSHHGDTREDPFFWLRQREDPAVLAYLEAENAYTTAVMADTVDLQERLYEEMRGTIQESDASVPYVHGAYLYYRRTVAGQQYPLFCRRLNRPQAEEEVLLDQNVLAADHAFFKVGRMEVSPDHRLLAYTVDTSGGERFTLYIKEIGTGRLLPDVLPEISYGVAWANDGKTLFYSVADETNRPYRLYRHRLGQAQVEDALLYEEEDGRFYLFLRRTRSGQYVVMYLRSSLTTEQWYVAADTPEAAFQVLYARQQGVKYYLAHRGDTFYIRTNEAAQNFKLVAVPVATPAKSEWRTILPHRDEVTLENVYAFDSYLVVATRERGLPQLLVLDLQGDGSYYIDFPDPAYDVQVKDNKEFAAETLRFAYSSLVRPVTVYDYDLGRRTLRERKREPVVGYEADQYMMERLEATAGDGTLVPITLVYKKGLVKDGQAPLYLTGYGAYGASRPIYFRATSLPLLNRGFVYAIAHIRGGGDMGKQWHEQGKLFYKMNTFTDFIACAEHLVALKYTSPERLVAMGRSAGGLLMGAVANMRPDLFAIIVAHVPFVDALNTMLDPSIPLTVIEYEEWGNPHEGAYYDYIKAYSPYDQVTAKAYPHILVTAGLNDPRVQYWEPAKWTAKLRRLKTDDNVLLLKTNMAVGHAGDSGRFDRLREYAFEDAFILKCVGKKF